MPRNFRFVFSLPLGICIYNLLRNLCFTRPYSVYAFAESLCSIVNVHIYINKSFSLCKGVCVNSTCSYITKTMYRVILTTAKSLNCRLTLLIWKSFYLYGVINLLYLGPSQCLQSYLKNIYKNNNNNNNDSGMINL